MAKRFLTVYQEKNESVLMWELIKELDEFPHVRQNIIDKWGTGDFRPYVKQLLINEERTIRQGFPPKIFSSVNKLLNLHDNLYQHLTPHKKPTWEYRKQ
jgi:hypothetical protein